MKHLALIVCSLVLATLASAPAFADTYTYTYTGNAFTTTEDAAIFSTSEFVSGSFTLGAPLAAALALSDISPTEFSFSDGHDTFADTPGATFAISTDSSGNVLNWVISVFSGGAGLTTGYYLSSGWDEDVAVFDNKAAYNGDPGTWTVADNPSLAATPEPSSLLLLGTSLLGAAGMLRRRLIS